MHAHLFSYFSYTKHSRTLWFDAVSIEIVSMSDPEGDVVSLHRDLIQKLSFLCFYFIFSFFCFNLL